MTDEVEPITTVKAPIRSATLQAQDANSLTATFLPPRDSFLVASIDAVEIKSSFGSSKEVLFKHGGPINYANGGCDSGKGSTTFFTTRKSDSFQVTEALKPIALEIHNDSHLHSHHKAMQGSTSKEVSLHLHHRERFIKLVSNDHLLDAFPVNTPPNVVINADSCTSQRNDNLLCVRKEDATRTTSNGILAAEG